MGLKWVADSYVCLIKTQVAEECCYLNLWNYWLKDNEKKKIFSNKFQPQDLMVLPLVKVLNFQDGFGFFLEKRTKMLWKKREFITKEYSILSATQKIAFLI